MKPAIYFVVSLSILTACKEQPVSLSEPVFLTYYASGQEKICDADSTALRGGAKGSVLLLTNNKALYAVRQPDTIQYYRGKYTLSENRIVCTFDAWYSHARKKNTKKSRKKVEAPSMKPVKPWSVQLIKTGCSDFVYYSTAWTPLDSIETAARFVYSDSETEKIHEYIARINNISALVDFHMEPPRNVADARYVPSALTASVENHYTGQNKKTAIVKRTETDSTIRLTFSYRKRKKGDPAGPYLYVTIPKLRSKSLRGDMNGDNREDLVLQPVLSQGGGSRWKEFFLFVNDGGGYAYKAQASTYDLAQHKKNSYSGTFHPEEIVNNVLIGTSVCYRDDDAQCCPSVKVPTSVRLENNHLKGERIVSK